MLIDEAKSRKLMKLGWYFAPETNLYGTGKLGFGCHTEIPVVLHSDSIGIYSYANSSISLCDIGNYCSIANTVRIGAAHPLTRLTTSPATCFPHVSESIFSGFAKKEYWNGGNVMTYIGHDVWIGTMTVIKEGIHIGNGAVVGAGSVVTHDVPDFAIVGGTPARLIRMRFADPLIERIQKTEWFLYDWQGIEIDWSHPEQALDTMEKYIAEDKAPQGKFYYYQADEHQVKLFAPGKAAA